MRYGVINPETIATAFILALGLSVGKNMCICEVYYTITKKSNDCDQ
jgi:hypothetical protein